VKFLLIVLQVLDFGAARDGVPGSRRGRRVVVDTEGVEIENIDERFLELDGANDR
jgi:F-box and WD-40 domain protein CDC4